MSKIKPCPFCARTPGIIEWNKNLYSMSCKCGAESPRDSKSKEGIIRIWNRRRYVNVKSDSQKQI